MLEAAMLSVLAAVNPVNEFLTGLRITEVGASGLLAIAVILILTGRLESSKRSAEWREAYMKEREVNQELRQQVSDLLSVSGVTARVLDSLPSAGGDSDVPESTTETRRRRRQSGS